MINLHIAQFFWSFLFSFFISDYSETNFSEQLSPYCPNTVPSYTVDLSSSPTGTWTSPSNVSRNDQCNCTLGTESCVEFVITLNPDAVGFVLRKTSGFLAV